MSLVVITVSVTASESMHNFYNPYSTINMKAVIIILALSVVAALGAPAEAPVAVASELARRSLPALEHEEDRDDLGQYTMRYVTAEGTIVSERARLIPTPDGTDKVLIYEGEYSFIGPDGRTYVTKYTTDIDGAHKVIGDHLPKAPELEVVLLEK